MYGVLPSKRRFIRLDAHTVIWGVHAIIAERVGVFQAQKKPSLGRSFLTVSGGHVLLKFNVELLAC